MLAVRITIIAAVVSSLLVSCSTIPDSLVHGHYTWGHEVRTFKPCGSAKTFWVAGDPALLQQLRKAAESSQAKPYDPIYVEVSGTLEAKATDGFAADYDGVYRFTDIHVVQKPAPGDCGSHG